MSSRFDGTTKARSPPSAPALSKDYLGNAFKRALRDAQRNIDKLSTQGLKAAYNGIIDAISKGNDEMIDKAIDVATQERARYFAERIARTEKARAYMDGAMYQYAHDPDCVSSSGNFRAAIHAMTFVICTPVQTFEGWARAFFKTTVGIMQGKLHGFTEKGAVIFLVFQSIWGSDEAGNHDPLAGSDSASIFIFFHPKAQHICYNNSNIVKF